MPEDDLPVIVARIRAAARPDAPRANFDGDVPFRAGGRSLVKHPDFAAAKAGDKAAAERLVAELVSDDLVARVRDAVGDGPIVLAYGRREGGNAIAEAFAERRAARLPNAGGALRAAGGQASRCGCRRAADVAGRLCRRCRKAPATCWSTTT